jgi:hypothetical protein
MFTSSGVMARTTSGRILTARIFKYSNPRGGAVGAAVSPMRSPARCQYAMRSSRHGCVLSRGSCSV